MRLTDIHADDLLAAARGAIRQKNPYFVSLVHGLVPYETEEVKTLGVTPGMVVYYNPKFIESLLKEGTDRAPNNTHEALDIAVSKTSFCLLHEGNHPMRRHFERRAGRDNDLWNKAGDLTINSDLRAMGWIPPNVAIFPEHYDFKDGLTTEQYYELLLKQREEQEAGARGKGQKPKPKPGDGEPGACAGQCGGGAGNTDKDTLEKAIDEEVGRSKADRERIEKQVANDVRQHVRNQGNVPGSFSEWANQLLKPPTVRWEKALQHALQATCGRIESGGHDYSFSRISKRSFIRRLIRPGLVSYMPDGAFILDVSGSVSTKEISILLRETAGILTNLGLERIWLLQADTQVTTKPQLVRSKDLRKVQIRGRGGTSFVQALEEIAQLRPRPSFVVYGTDMYGTFPTKPPPGIAVIWAVLPGGSQTATPPFGKVVHIKE